MVELERSLNHSFDFLNIFIFMLFIVLPILFLRKIQKASLKVVLTEVIVKYDKYGDSQEVRIQQCDMVIIIIISWLT